MKRKLLIGFAAIMIFAFGIRAGVAAKADFSGIWTLDASRSEGMPPGLMQTMTVTQNGDRIEIETKSKVGEGPERVGKDVYVLNGKETDFISPVPGVGANKAKRVSKWTDDGNGFEMTEESVVNAPGGGGEATDRAKRRWKLYAEGKVLVIEMENSNGTSKSKRVFVKK